MLVEKLANFRPWIGGTSGYCPFHHPGDTRISLSSVTDKQKHELEEMMDSMFVRNEHIPSELHLSHDENEVRPFLFGFHRTVAVSKPGLKKVRQDNPAGGHTINYELGRIDNDYLYRARALINVGPQEAFDCVTNSRSIARQADEAYIGVHLYSPHYGDMLIREIFRRYNPDVSRELKVAKMIFGEYVQRVLELPQKLIELSPKMWDLLERLDSNEPYSALRDCTSLGREEVDTLISIADDGWADGNWYGCCPLNVQIAAVRGLAETGDPIAKNYLGSMLEVQTIQASEESNPRDIYTNVRGALFRSLCGDGFSTYPSANREVSKGETLRIIQKAQQRINETAASR